MQVLPDNPVEQNVYVSRLDPIELKVAADLVTVPPLNIVRVATSIRLGRSIRLYTTTLLKLWLPALINNQAFRSPVAVKQQLVCVEGLIIPSLHFEAVVADSRVVLNVKVNDELANFVSPK